MVQYKTRSDRRARVREAVPEYRTPQGAQPLRAPGVYHVTVTDRGRLVLPAEVRTRLNIRDGDRVAVTIEEDGTITVITREVAIRQLRGMFKRPGRRGRLASEELIAERRREARKDDREFRDWNARLRQAGK
jgi:AbrB family looped-hinge helix DNA binding protein